MINFEKCSAKILFAVLVVTSLTLSACVTKPERRGPSPDRQCREGPPKSSGTFMKPIGAVFAAMDENSDKLISRPELKNGITAEWASFGRKPSAAYFAQWSIANLGSIDAMPTFLSFDRDFNGVVSESEFAGQLETEFERLDKNSDSRLERSEMLVAFQAPQGRERQRGSQDGKKGKGKGGGRPPR